jgi:4-amino-4-deoxy-L-arabinose transferase-like glycosyltransferase
MAVSDTLEKDQASAASLKWAAPVAAACLVHCLLWSVVPLLYLGNLHTDTVEATSWATHWDFGYVKHPPLVVWLLNMTLALPGSRMFKDLALSQATVAISAWFIWKTVGLYVSQRMSALATLAYLASPPATFFAVQVNHNSLSIPFGAAILFFGLRYFQNRRGSDAVLLGLAGGLGLLTKYQTAFFLISLAVLAIRFPKFRWVWRDPRSYLAAALCLVIFAPHLWWDYQHGWKTLLYASADRPIKSLRDVGSSFNELLDGILMCAAGPILIWLALGLPKLSFGEPEKVRMGAWILATPIAVMVVLGFASGQIMRQGWLIPLIPAIIVGASLIVSVAPGPPPAALSRRSMLLSAGQVLAFAAFLLGRATSGGPVAAYSLDGKELAKQVQAIWRASRPGEIPCMILPNRSFGLATMLYLEPIPLVVDLDVTRGPNTDPLAACRAAGGVALTPSGNDFNQELRALGLVAARATVGTWPRMGRFEWPFEVYVIPPGN